MASAFSHALVGAGIGLLFRAHAPTQISFLAGGGPVRDLNELQRARHESRRRVFLKWAPLSCGLLAASPDLDVAMHAFVRYEDAWGHRGAFHSPSLYLVAAVFLAFICGARLWMGALAFLTLVSHSILDMLTTGGLGVAMLWPLSAERFFLPWQVIPVSPLSVSSFFGEWGRRVLASEMKWALPLFVVCFLYERLIRNRDRSRIPRPPL